MAMTHLLHFYLDLERLMMVAEGIDEGVANSLRDAMDPIWHSLTDADREVLDQREVNFITSLEGLRIPVSDHLYCAPSGPLEKRPIPKEPIEGWRKAA